MVTRNEWIAETAREFAVHGRLVPDGRLSWDNFPLCIDSARAGADYLEAANVAPWQTPAPALTDTAAKVVEATEAWLVQYESDPIDEFASADCRLALAAAVRAHLAAKQGGAS